MIRKKNMKQKGTSGGGWEKYHKNKAKAKAAKAANAAQTQTQVSTSTTLASGRKETFLQDEKKAQDRNTSDDNGKVASSTSGGSGGIDSIKNGGDEGVGNVAVPPILNGRHYTHKQTSSKLDKRINYTKRCSAEDCNNQAVQGGVCVKHGAKKAKKCSVEDCNNQAQKGGVCIKHGAKKAEKKRCSVEDCNNQAQKGGVCKRHGANFKLCSFVGGCTKGRFRKGMCMKHLRQKHPDYADAIAAQRNKRDHQRNQSRKRANSSAQNGVMDSEIAEPAAKKAKALEAEEPAGLC